MENFIEINRESFNPVFYSDEAVQFRSLEKRLESLKRDFGVTDHLKSIRVAVHDKVDAIILGNKLMLVSIVYFEGGLSSEIKLKAPRKSGRPKNIVHVNVTGVDKSMTLNQFKKYSLEELKKTHVTKSQILEKKFISKSKLEKYIADGTLQTVSFSNKIYINRNEILKLL